MKIAVVGCGYWGPNWVRNFTSLLERGEIVCCDTDTAMLARIKSLYPHVATTTRIDDVVNDPDIHAVTIATPVTTHFELVKQCLLARKHVLVEKPMASSSAECVELTRLAEAVDRTLMVGHTFEYSVAVNRAKEIIASGELGDIMYLSFQRLNLGPYRSDVNVVWDLAAHDISILLYFLDALPVGVNAQGQAFLMKDNEDVITATLRFGNGVVAFISDSWLNPHKVRQATVVGTRKMLVYDDVSVHEKIKIFDKGIDTPSQYDTFADFHFSYRYGDIYTPRIEEQEPLKLECMHFLDCIRNGQTPRSDGASATRVVRILEAISQSISQRGQFVPISYDAENDKGRHGPGKLHSAPPHIQEAQIATE